MLLLRCVCYSWCGKSSVDMKGCQNEQEDKSIQTIIGSRISIDDNIGTVRYIGEVDGTKGLWLGVEWDNPERGKHNGVHNGRSYFSTSSQTSGSFVRPERLRPRRSCAQAIKERYGDEIVEVLTRKERKLASSVDKVIEFVGAQKMASKISNLSKIKEVSLKNMCISGEENNEELETLTPNLQDLDLSQNLISSWQAVANIVAHLPSLRSLILSENQITIPENPKELSLHFNHVNALILNKMQYTWSKVLKCSVVWPNVLELSLNNNLITSLERPHSETLQNLKYLDLSYNKIQSWQEVEKLGHLKSLEKLILTNVELNEIKVSSSENILASLDELDISQNNLLSWQDIDELNKLPKLEKLKVLNNPVIKSDTWETSRQLVIAKISRLSKLDGIQISKQERKDAERDYLKRYFQEWHEYLEKNSNNNTNEDFTKIHPNYKKLVEVYGASEKNEVVPQNISTKIPLISLQIYSPLMPEKPLMTKKFPASMTVAKLKSVIHRLYRVPVGDLMLSYRTTKVDQTYELNNDLQTLSYFAIKNGDTIEVHW